MDALLPFLEVQGPDGQISKVELTKDHVTVGRFHDFNDVGLEPDPQQLVTRKAHCTIDRDAEGWCVTDNGSVNRTFLRRGQNMEVIAGRIQISDGDIIRILGRLSKDGKPVYWDLTFRDPLKTQPANPKMVPRETPYLEYDWIQAKLFRINGVNRREISSLRPQEHKLIRYMDQRNRANGNVPVMCEYEELINAIWEEDATRTNTDVNHLIWELRQKLEFDPKEPEFIQTERGLGYRLFTNAAD